MSVVGPIVIKHGEAPARRKHRGKVTERAPVYRAIQELKPGGHFECPNTRRLTAKQEELYINAVRNWIRDNEYEDCVEVYPTEGFGIVVRHRQAAP